MANEAMATSVMISRRLESKTAPNTNPNNPAKTAYAQPDYTITNTGRTDSASRKLFGKLNSGK